MTRGPKYALDPALALRERKAETAARDLGVKVRSREDADQARQRAEEAKRDAAAKAAKVKADEHAALLRGELSVADLARENAWSLRVQMDKAELERSAAQAEAALEAATKAETAARGELGARRADADVVQKDKSAWQTREAKAREAKAEEEAADAWRPKTS